MTTMIERVMAAMRQANGNVSDVLVRHMAYAAIAAMREPTQNMIIAGLAVDPPGSRHNIGDLQAASYRAMIDRALAEPEPNDRGS